MAFFIGCGDRADAPVQPTSSHLALLSVTPTQGAEAGGTRVLLRGYGFRPGMTATFDGIAGRDVNVLSDILLTVIVPPHAKGLADIVVTGPDGQTTVLIGQYRYTDTDAVDDCAGCWDYDRAALARAPVRQP